jgi:D-glycero-D-manno-heptose 1,7-bisphosphate phosphatase
VFLDRDGVINRSIVRNGVAHSPLSLAELEIPADVPDALERLRLAGFGLIVVTNQPNVARGVQTRATIEELHDYLAARLPIDEFRVCFHDDAAQCRCRKPEPGMLLQEPRYAISRSFMIGDRWRDIAAGHRAGCSANILIGDGYGEFFPVDPDIQCATLGEAADWILGSCGGRQAILRVQP